MPRENPDLGAEEGGRAKQSEEEEPKTRVTKAWPPITWKPAKEKRIKQEWVAPPLGSNGSTNAADDATNAR